MARIASCFLAVGCVSSSYSVEIESEKLVSSVSVDGELGESEWVMEYSVASTVSGTNDNTVTFGTLWDDDYLYVGARVLDYNLIEDSDKAWDDDSIEVYVDGDHDEGSFIEGTTDRLVWKGYSDNNFFEDNAKKNGILCDWSSISGGYSVEIAIPWSQISVSPQDGTIVGFDVGNVDDDNGSGPDGHKLWHGSTNNVPSMFGDLKLVDSSSGGSGGGGSGTPPALPVIPGVYGYGIDTRAAYGGTTDPQVIKVTNLDSSGSGSFKAAVESTGPRIVVFEVSGEIEVDGTVSVSSPYLTIAGQTAPIPGITLKQTTLNIKTHDILVQHLRFRQGDGSGTPSYDVRDCMTIGNSTSGQVYNVVIDHCSVSWATDENIAVWRNGGDISFINNIISEALYDSYHSNGPHSKGLLTDESAGKISMIGNIFAHNHERNPLAQNTELVFVNNVLYNYWNKAVELQNLSGITSKNTIQGNVFVEGGDTSASTKAVYIRGNGSGAVLSGSEVFVHDNDSPDYVSDDWDVVANPSSVSVRVNQAPVWVPGLVAKAVANDEAYDWVLNSAGARPLDRDAVDIRIIDDIENGTGSVIDSQSEVGGFPTLAENTETLVLPANPHDDDDSDGYTNLEEWLHAYAEDVESLGSGGSGDTTPPSAPNGLSANAVGASSIDLDWNDNGESDFTSYSVYRGSSSGFTPSTGNRIASGLTASSYDDTGLSASTTYYYKVTALDSSGNESSASSAASATTASGGDATAPSAPSGLSANAAGASSIDLDWSDNGESDFTSYSVYRGSSSGFTPSTGNRIASGLTASSYDDTGLSASTTYYYKVTALDSSGNESSASSEGSATTASGGDTTPPSAPSGLSATADGASSIDLDWSDSGESDFASYSVYRGSSSGFTPSAGNRIASGLTASSYDDTGLSASTPYYYKVTALDSSGNESSASSAASATTGSAQAGLVYASKTLDSISIDGSLSESVWSIDQSVTTTVAGTNNNTTTFGVLWDDTYLYVGVKVLDGSLYNDSQDRKEDDTVEVALDTDHNGGGFGSVDRQFLKRYNDSSIEETDGRASNVRHAWSSITGGYSVEIAIPWSNLNLTPSSSLVMGFDVGVHDDDDSGDADNVVFWHNDDRVDNKPTYFGDIELSAATVGGSE